MRRTGLISSLLLAALVLGVPGWAAAASDDGDDDGRLIHVQQVSERVWAGLQPEALRFADANAVLINRGNHLVLVDAPGNPLTAEAWVAAIERLSNMPVEFVITTHWHSDHTQGIRFYREKFFGNMHHVGHHSQVEEITQRARPELAATVERWQKGVAEAEANGPGEDDPDPSTFPQRLERARKRVGFLERMSIPLPVLTFQDELVLRGTPDLHLFSFAAHTRGDVIIWIPEEKVLITGDVVDDLPFGGHGYPGSWLETLRRLEKLDVEFIVPGHGRIRQGKDHLRTVRRLVETLLDAARKGVADGLDAEAILARAPLKSLKKKLAGEDGAALRNWDRFVPATLERAMAEVKGELD